MGKDIIRKLWYGGSPFLVICLCGLFGVLVDFDHIIQILWFPEAIYGARFHHTPTLIIAGTIFLCTCSYIGRLYCLMVLDRLRRRLKRQ